MAEAKLRPPSFAVMMIIQQQRQPVSQKQVSDRLGIDPSDLVAIFDLLEQAGLIVRERDENDRRRHALHLTQLGKVRLRRFEELAAEVSEQLFAVLDTDELETLGSLVQRVVDEQFAAEG